MKKKRQQYLYHGSTNDKLKVLTPKPSHGYDNFEGDALFAARKNMASIFLGPKTGKKIEMVNGHMTVIIANKKEYIKRDNGGTLYKVKADSFRDTPNSWSQEKYTKRKIKPVGKIKYDSSLDAMMNNGVQVYFVPESVLVHALRSKNKKTVFKNIIKKRKSENQKRKKKIKK